MTDADVIRLRGARQHNLRGVDLDVPVGRMTVVTGVSGSGKSSLAFHTLYAEGQRRYVETFSAYARQFLERMDRPAVDAVEGIPPAIALERRGTLTGGRSTVATLAEVHDPLRLLWARVADLSCTACGEPVRPDLPATVADALQAEAKGSRWVLAFEVGVGRAAALDGTIQDLSRAGFTRLWTSDGVVDLDRAAEAWPLEGPGVVVVDRVVVGRTARARLLDSVETAFRAGGERLLAIEVDGAKRLRFSAGLACAACGTRHRAPRPATFSFNSPLGACERCSGFGRVTGVDHDLVVPLPRATLEQGAVRPFETPAHRKERSRLLAWARENGVPTDVPWRELPAAVRRTILEGGDGYDGVEGHFARLRRKSYKVHVRVHIARYRGYPPCPDCRGTRLGPEGRAWRVFGRTLPEVLALSVTAARALFHEEGDPARLVSLPADRREVVRLLRREIEARLTCLDDVGLGYLTLDRAGRTLSGGEVQRVHLTAAIGTNLTGALFVLDEPSVGLHPQDTARLVTQLRRLVQQGNTVVVVEHDAAVLAAADHVVDLGPGAGEHSGRIVAQGTTKDLVRVPESITGRWLAGARSMPAPRPRPEVGASVGVKGADANNLQGVDLIVRLGELTALAGVSGSGKSTLAHDVLYLALARALGRPEGTPGVHAAVVGAEALGDVVLVDQAASGASSRANPATYVGAWDAIRTLLAATPAAKSRKLAPGAFSFNVPGGRCEACQGDGLERIEMLFLSDIELVCSECEGTRFRPVVREVLWQGHSVSDLLALSVEDALALFENAQEAPARRAGAALEPVARVGLGYLRLGQRASTLSSGEWQRLRLAAALGEKRVHKPRLYVFDEPTTGLHMEDVARLLTALRHLAERGHGVLVVEHHPELLASADRLVELGPGAGAEGGRVVADGTPDEVAQGDTATAPFLRDPLAAIRPGRKLPPARSRAPAGIEIRGARHHNLKDVNIDVPRDRFTVVSGPSGSGKSSLAFDIVFAEGQRRYIETLGSYARQFVGGMARPDVDHVAGIPPTVAIEQRRSRGGRRSTVATVTEISHHVRVLFARAGEAHCPLCDRPLAAQQSDDLADVMRATARRAEARLLAPRIWGRKGFHRDVLEAIVRHGGHEAWVDGALVPLEPLPQLDRYAEHDIAEVVAHLPPRATAAAWREAVAAALGQARGTLGLLVGGEAARWYAGERTCPEHGIGVPEMDPRLFSHNSRRGWCPSCRGLGTEPEIDPQRVPVAPGKTLSGGALPLLRLDRDLRKAFVREARAAFGFSAQTRWENLPAATRNGLLAGRKRPAFVGAAERIAAHLRDSGEGLRDRLGDIVRDIPCRTCGGSRLRPEASAVRVGGRTLPDLLALPLADLGPALEALDLDARAQAIAKPLLGEIRERIDLLGRLGLGYLGLDRDATTLSGGEAQRLRIAAQLGSPLRGVLYVLDEPTIGLHARDNRTLVAALRGLASRGNGLLVVEHDLETIEQADHVIDLGPGGGRHGGHIVAQGTPAELRRLADTPTGRLMARPAPTLSEGAAGSGHVLALRGFTRHNLVDVDVDVPLGALVVVTGVSGAGKSTLVHGGLVPAVADVLADRRRAGGARLEGAEHVGRLVEVDASPLGSTPRSVPATYLGIWDDLRRLLAATPEARARGYGPGRFSFNTPGGRCPACDGRGEAVVEMTFLPDVRVPCERCDGARFEPETLEIRWQGLSAADLLGLTFEEAAEKLVDLPRVAPLLALMVDVGLGYLTLGQPSPTLSGGEAQRMRMVGELGAAARADTPGTLYVLDEPTIGLHGEDVDRLIATLRRFVERGDTVLVIEHHLDLIAAADHVIDLGPGAGAAGGRVVATGSPREVARGTTATAVALAEAARPRRRTRRRSSA